MLINNNRLEIDLQRCQKGQNLTKLKSKTQTNKSRPPSPYPKSHSHYPLIDQVLLKIKSINHLVRISKKKIAKGVSNKELMKL